SPYYYVYEELASPEQTATVHAVRLILLFLDAAVLVYAACVIVAVTLYLLVFMMLLVRLFFLVSAGYVVAAAIYFKLRFCWSYRSSSCCLCYRVFLLEDLEAVPAGYDIVPAGHEQVLVIIAFKDNLRKLKRKDVVDDVVISHPIDPELLKFDVAPLSPKLQNNKRVHSDYLKHTQEQIATLREIVGHEKSLNLLNISLDCACRVKFGNDHVAKIMGYDVYQIGNVTISRVYFVDGLGHNLFSIGQFCDSDLKVAFRQHTSFIYNLEAFEVIAPIAEVVTLELIDSTSSPSSTTIDQDAPLPSKSQTTPETQPPVIPNNVEEDNHDIEVAHMTYKDALTQSCWIKAMQKELNEFECLDVWELVPRPNKVMVITLKWIYKVKLDELGVDTPMVEKSKLDEDKEGKAVDPSHYRGMTGTLLYLIASRPDLQFAICMCARYQARPIEKNLHAVKRIFRYLRGTINRGLWYLKVSSITLTIFVDVDHADCQDTRRSTSDKVMVITLKWIYKVKLYELGGILKNKARLVAHGYHQEKGIDFEEYFAS
nr:hypothetical protein [Tanacetum cinerariifolium]